MENRSKFLTFIGFSIKARKIRCGVNAIATLKGGVKLLIVCSTASENTKKDAVKLSKKFNAKLYELSGYVLENVVYKEKCKLVAVTDTGLAKAIVDNADGHLTVYSGGLV